MADPIVDVYDFIYNLAHNMLECHHLSLDMAQRVFMEYTKQLRKNPNMDEGYKRFWVIRATKNRCLNYIRDNKRISFVDPANFPELTDCSPDPRQLIEHDEEKKSIYDLLKKNLDKLPENQRRVIHLRFYEELSYNDIVKKTGYSLTKLKSMVHRIIKLLNKKMVK